MRSGKTPVNGLQDEQRRPSREREGTRPRRSLMEARKSIFPKADDYPLRDIAAAREQLVAIERQAQVKGWDFVMWSDCQGSTATLKSEYDELREQLEITIASAALDRRGPQFIEQLAGAVRRFRNERPPSENQISEACLLDEARSTVGPVNISKLAEKLTRDAIAGNDGAQALRKALQRAAKKHGISVLGRGRPIGGKRTKSTR